MAVDVTCIRSITEGVAIVYIKCRRNPNKILIVAGTGGRSQNDPAERFQTSQFIKEQLIGIAGLPTSVSSLQQAKSPQNCIFLL